MTLTVTKPITRPMFHRNDTPSVDIGMKKGIRETKITCPNVLSTGKFFRNSVLPSL